MRKQEMIITTNDDWIEIFPEDGYTNYHGDSDISVEEYEELDEETQGNYEFIETYWNGVLPYEVVEKINDLDNCHVYKMVDGKTIYYKVVIFQSIAYYNQYGEDCDNIIQEN